MRVIVDMLIIVTDKCDEKRKAKLMQIMQRAGIEGECKKDGKEEKIYYRFCRDQKDPMVQIYFELDRRKYKGIGCWGVSYTAQYTQEEKQKIVGYRLNNGRICHVNDSYEEDCREWCDACGDYAAQKAPIVVKRSKSLLLGKSEKRIYLSDYFMANGEFFVSEAMYSYLLENGVSEENFIPAYFGKRKKELACYQIKPVHILPPRSIQYENCEVTSVCPECGNTRLEKKGIRKYYEGAYIDMDKIDFIDDINASKEYYEAVKMTIVSPRVYELLKKEDPNTVGTPLFPLTMKEEMERSAMP